MDYFTLLPKRTPHESVTWATSPPRYGISSHDLMTYADFRFSKPDALESKRAKTPTTRDPEPQPHTRTTTSAPHVLTPHRPLVSETSRTHLRLPITLHMNDTLATVLACADTGADVNVISEDLVEALGYRNYKSSSEKLQVVLANGKLVEAVGQIQATCSFGVEAEVSKLMTCLFYVFAKAATSMIIGFDFLEQTRTMTEHRRRLVRVPRPIFPAFSVYSIGRPKRLLNCELNRREILAMADSGSEIDLISTSFAHEHGLTAFARKEVVQFADGSLAVTAGFVRTQLSIAPPNANSVAIDSTYDITIDLFLLDGLAHEVIVGGDSLLDLKVFAENQHALLSVLNGSGPLELNHIRKLGRLDRVIDRIKRRGKGKINSKNKDDDPETIIASSSDQRENARISQEERRFAVLPFCQRDDEQSDLVRRSRENLSIGPMPLPTRSRSPDPGVLYFVTHTPAPDDQYVVDPTRGLCLIGASAD